MATLILLYIGFHFVTWIPSAVGAWKPSHRGMIFVSLRIGFYASFLALFLFLLSVSAPIIGPGGLILMLMVLALQVTLATDLLVWVIALYRNAKDRLLGLILAPGLFALAMTISGIGATLWSEFLPQRILTNAADLAGDRAYCILNGSNVVASRRDLTAWSIWSTRGQFRSDMHSILVVSGSEAKREHWNWSFNAGRFVNMTQSALNVMEPVQIDCQPEYRFAEGLR